MTTWTAPIEYWANKDGKRQRIGPLPDDVKEGVFKAYEDAGYSISMTEDVYEANEAGTPLWFIESFGRKHRD